MSISFHKGLTDKLKMTLQMTGLRIEEIDAQRALAGHLVVDAKTGKPSTGNEGKVIYSEAAKWVREAVTEVLENNLALTREWENNNPESKPFKPMFAEEVLRVLQEIDSENFMETVNQLREMAEEELWYG